MDLFDYLLGLAAAIPWASLIRALVLLGVGLVLARMFRRVIMRGVFRQLSGSQQRIGQRVGSWLIIGLFAAAGLHQLGFNLSVLLGAAGVLSVAVGFASQTSAANLISGLFLLGERTIQVGDQIQVGARTGEVLSVDLLSVKLRTADNLYVRIPNEMLIKNEMVNFSKLPIRRFDLRIGIDYNADIGHARAVLLEVAAANPTCLDEPKPTVIQLGFGESSVDLQLSVWAARECFGDLRNAIQEEVKAALDAAGIGIPFPHRALSLTAPEQPLRVMIEQPQRERPA